jgi:hypothetical protein
MNGAIWLMERCGVADALIGDLVEASAHHRHHWFWRHAVAEAVAALARDIAAHPILALRAVLIGFLLWSLGRLPLDWLWSQLNVGFVLAMVHVGLRHQIAIMSGIARTMLFMPAWVGLGWLLARLHRTRTPAMVLIFLAVTWFLTFPATWRLLLDAIDHARFRPYFAVNLFGLIVFNLSVIAGALRVGRVPVLTTPNTKTDGSIKAN